MRLISLVMFRVLIVSVSLSLAPVVALDLEAGLDPMPSDLLDLMWEAEQGPFIPDAVIENESDKYYWLFRSNALGFFDPKKQKNIAGWSLSRWQYLTPPTYILNELKGYGQNSFLKDLKLSRNAYDYVGCFSDSPLRMGDIEGDGQNELFLFLDEEMMVFSPEHEEVVFSMFLSANDLMRVPDYAELHGAVSAVDGKRYQYASSIIGNRYEKAHQAHRSYTKVYEGDFDKDGNPDLLTWQKIYASNEVGDIPGFSLVDSQWQHFERDLEAQELSEQGITGEYLPQGTGEETIQIWLSESELTWVKGFPSVSECEGREGKLIQEMHDTLLNDPEVLQ